MNIARRNNCWTNFLCLFLFILLSANIFFVESVFAENTALNQFRIVFIAYENPEQLVENVKPVIDYLKKQLGMDVKYFVATDYGSVVEALRNETADMGFMGPLQYVMAHEHAGAKPILGEIYNGKSSYVSHIFVRKDSGIKNLGDLKGKTIAFVDPLSSSGYMYPLDLFKQKGLVKNKEEAEKFFKRIYFAGGDEQALRAVLNKFVNAAGIGQYAYRLLRPEEREEVIHIAESNPIPSHCVVVRRDLDLQITEKITEALMALNHESHRALLKYLYNVEGYVKVSHDNYQEVEDVAREYGFIKGKK